jgi:hypothetical protein
MVDKIDTFVCNPNAGINKDLSGIYIQFDVLDQKGVLTGATHAVAMPTSQAMLRLLEHLQQKFSLPKPEEEITENMIAAAQAGAGEAQK